MPVLSVTELVPDVKEEATIVGRRAETCAEAMSQPTDRSNRVYDWADADPRLSSAAAFFIEVADFVDSVDHRTSDEMGGTDKIQNIALEVRELVREYMADVKEEL